MQRLIFWGAIILAVVLLFSLISTIIYWLLRIFLAKPTARITCASVVIVMLVVMGLSAWWGHTHTRLQANVTHTDICSSRLPAAFDGYRIAQISDLHLDSFSHEEGAKMLSDIATLMHQEQPDLIVFTGDIVTFRAAQLVPFAQPLSLLSQVPARSGQGFVPVYSILGNHDYADYVRQFTPERRQQDVDSLISLQTTAGWHMLRNASVLLQAADSSQQIALVGVENIGEPPFSVYGDLGLAMSDIGGIHAADSIFTVLLSHNPTHWRREVLPSTAIDLTLSGHTHATQILIGQWSPARWKYDEWMGLYSEGDQHLYVNTGIGSVGPAVRIGIKPEVSVLTLRCSND